MKEGRIPFLTASICGQSNKNFCQQMELPPREHNQWQAVEKSCFKDHSLSLYLKGTRAVLPVLIFSHFLLQRTKSERDSTGRGVGSQQLSIRLEKELLWLLHLGFAFSCPFLGETALRRSTGAPYCPFWETPRAACTAKPCQLCTLSIFLMKQSQKFKIVVPPFIQQKQFIVITLLFHRVIIKYRMLEMIFRKYLANCFFKPKYRYQLWEILAVIV